MTTVNIHEAKTHFSKLLKRVMNGEEIHYCPCWQTYRRPFWYSKTGG